MTYLNKRILFMNKSLLTFIVEDHGNNTLVELLKTKTKDQEQINVMLVEAKGPQASVLLLMTTFIVAAFAEGFFSRLGEISAEELVDIFKDIKSNQVEPEFITVGGPSKSQDKGFSLHHSFYRPSHNSKTIKFLFKKNWSMEHFNSACIIMMNELRLYEKNKPNQITPLIDNNRPIAGLYLLSVNLEDNSIYSVDLK